MCNNLSKKKSEVAVHEYKASSTDDQLKLTELQLPNAMNREAIHCFHSEESDTSSQKNRSIYKDYILPL